MSKILMCGLIAFSPNTVAAAEFIVWNVGQGQWVTEVHEKTCLHYDLGGEKNPLRKVLKVCGKKKNFLHLSHWDWDHISFAAAFSFKAFDTCLVEKPAGKPSAFKRRQIDSIRICSESDLAIRKSLSSSLHQPHHAKSSNGLSQVFWSRKFQVLMPGDSTRTEEKIWTHAAPSRAVGLILGHHGSRTSSSDFLFDRLNHLKWAVASARKSRYGHPHPQVVRLLKKEKVPLLKTEDWGHLHFMSNSAH